MQVVLGVLMARPGAADTSTREAALGVIRALCTQRGAIHKPNVVRLLGSMILPHMLAPATC